MDADTQADEASSTQEELLRTLSAPVTVPSDEHGDVHLRRVTLGNLPDLIAYAKRDASPRDFVVGFIARQITTPVIDAAAISEWSDDTLVQVATAWLRADVEPHWSLPNGASRLVAIQDALRDCIRKHQAQMEQVTTHAARAMKDLTRPLHDQVRTLMESFTHLSRSHLAGVTPPLQSLAKGFDLPDLQVLLGTRSPVLDLAATLHKSPDVARLLDNAGLATPPSVPMLSSDWDVTPSSLTTALDGLRQNIALIGEAARTAMSGIQPDLDVFIPKVEIGDLFGKLPDLTTLVPQWETLERAEAALREAGFGFTGNLWAISFLLPLADIAPRARPAAVTNRMLAVIRTGTFREELLGCVARSAVLRRRGKIMERGLEAHLRCDYILSVPALLTQLEGAVGDALVLKGSVRAKGHKLYVRLPNGKIQMQKGKPVEVRGLASLVDRSGFRRHDVLDLAAELIVTTVVRERNGILHGRHTRYDTAKLSAQLLLLLCLFAQEIAAFEVGEVTW